MNKYICINHNTEETPECQRCCGATNICGKYENGLDIDPFKKLHEQRIYLVQQSWNGCADILKIFLNKKQSRDYLEKIAGEYISSKPNTKIERWSGTINGKPLEKIMIGICSFSLMEWEIK